MKRLIMLLLAAVLAAPVLAHKPSDAYLTVIRDGANLTGQWDIALRDLDLALGLDANGDGDITWGEVRGKQDAIAALATQRLALSSGGEKCAMRVIGLQIDTHSDGAYAVLPLAGNCPHSGPTVAIEYALLFELDPQHRGLLNFVEGGKSQSVVHSSDHPRHIVGGETGGPVTQFAAYAHEGIWHIWLGLDPILFLF
jgi:hypothetical protein